MPPEAVVEQGLEAMKIFLGDVQKARENGAQVRSLKHLKVVLVGSASSGKTRCLTFCYYLIVGLTSFKGEQPHIDPLVCSNQRQQSFNMFCCTIVDPKALHHSPSVGCITRNLN